MILILRITPEELEYLGNAVGQMDIEYVACPDELNEKLHALADKAKVKIDRLGWAFRP